MRYLINCLIVLALSGCGNGSFQAEQIHKTRPIGMATNPISLSPATTAATLTLHVASPLGTTLNFSSTSLTYITALGIPQEIATTNSFATATDYNDLSHHQGILSFDVPGTDAISPSSEVSIPLLYTITISDGTAKIVVKGKTLVYGEGHPALAFKAHTLTIDNPVDTVPNNEKFNLAATITKGQEERIKAGWLVPNGKIQNRRDITTVWQPDTKGASTIILSIRGKDSQAMAVVFRDIIIQ
jgi:hypothetical protein